MIFLLLMGFVSGEIFAQGGEFVTTGSGIRVKKILLMNVNVYSITHQMKTPPSPKSAQAIIDADVEKKFTLKLMRDIDAEKISNAIKEAYGKNGYSNTANINTISSILVGDIKEGGTIVFSYNPTSKTTTCSFAGKTTTVTGADFMKATWSIWFGKIDQPALTEALMSKI